MGEQNMWLRQLFDNISATGQPPAPAKQRHKTKRQTKKNSFNNNYRKSVSHKKARTSSPKNNNTLIAYHGTPSSSNAASIFKHGWIVGSGNAYGDGIYFTQNISEAKSYAGSGGVYLKCIINMGKTCQWNNGMEKQYSNWCKAGNINPDNSAKTSFLLQKRFKTLKAGNIVVVLEPQYQNPSAWKRKNHRIRILSVHRAKDDKRIRV